MKNIEGPGKFHAKECDVSSEESIDSVFEWIKKTFGTFHILINNAAVMKEGSIAGKILLIFILSRLKGFLELFDYKVSKQYTLYLDASTKEMQFIINVNVMGALICAKRAMQLMKENGEEGHIVNINR